MGTRRRNRTHNLGNDTMVGENRGNSNCRGDWVFLVPIIILGIVCRVLHLFGAHYFLLGTDSYYFVSQARDISDAVLQGSGLTYPVAWLPAGAYWLPVVIGVALIITCYWFGSRLYNRLTGFSAAFVAAILPQAVYITAAGNIDRDGYSVLLIAVAIYVWWRFRHRWRWVPAAFVISGVIAFSWAWVSGVIIPIAIILLWLIMRKRESLPLAPVGVFTATTVAAGVIGALISGQIDTFWDYLFNTHDIAELQSTDLFALVNHYGFLLIPLGYGIAVVLSHRDNSGVMVLAWAVMFCAAGFWAQRVMVFAVPAVAVLAGYGLAVTIQGLRDLTDQSQAQKRFAVLLSGIVLVVVGMSGYQASQIGSYHGVAAGDNWVEALDYIEAETAPDSRILAHWDYGKWIDYLADRDPVGGIHAMDFEFEIEHLYEHPDYLPELMARTDADYFIAESDKLGLYWHLDNCYIPTWYEKGGIVIYRR